MANGSARWPWLLAVLAGAVGLSLWLLAQRDLQAPPLSQSTEVAVATAPANENAAIGAPPTQRTDAVPAPPPAVAHDASVAGPPSAPNGTVRVTGRCLAAESRQPLAECIIRASRAGPIAARTAADGTFDVDVALDTTGRIDVYIEASDRVPRHGQFEHLRAGALEAVGDILLPRGFVVSGRVVDPDGVAVMDNKVVVFGVDTTMRAGQYGQGMASAACAADGTFTLDMPMPPGEWRATTLGPRQLRGDGVFRVDPVLGAEPLVLVVEHENGISGVVVDDQGQPMMGVWLITEHGGASADSNPNGTFRLTPPQAASGPTRVLLRDPGHWSPAFVPPTVEWGQKDVRVVLPRGPSVTIEVVDEQGAPVVEFGVLFVPEEGARYKVSRDHGIHPGGTVTVPATRPGRHVLRVLPEAPDLLASEPQIVEVTGEGMPTQRVNLERLRETGVSVVGDDGTPIVGAAVSLVRVGKYLAWAREGDHDPRKGLVWDPDFRTVELVAAAVSTADGQATLFAPAATTGFLLRVRAEGYEPAFVPDPPLSPTAPLRVVLTRGGAIAGRVELHGQARELFRIDVRRADGSALRLDWQRLQLQPDGVFSVPLLPVGDYVVTVLRLVQVTLPGTGRRQFVPFGGSVVRTPVVAGETTNVLLDAPVMQLGVLNGRVLGIAPGGDRHVALLSLLGTANAQRGAFPIADDGSFTADELPPGRYQLAVAADQHMALEVLPALLAPEFDIVPGGVHTQDFTFTRRKLTLRLRTPEGTAVQANLEIRCGALRRYGSTRGELVFDPAPELPIAVRLDGGTEWSLPAVMPQDRAEHSADVVVPGR